MPTLPAGQEELVRRMVAPALPAGWAFVRAEIQGSEVRAHYRRGAPPRARAELRLAHAEAAPEGVAVGRLRVRLLAPREAPAVGALRAALLDAVRAGEGDLAWERPAVPSPAVPDPGATSWEARGPPPAPPPAAEPARCREARAAFVGGRFDEALGLLLDDGAPPEEARAALALRVELAWRLGRYREALADLDGALARAPGDVALLATAAVLRSELHDDARAAAHARAVALHAGASAGLLLQAATVLRRAGHDGEACAVARRALDAAPRASAALLADAAGLHRDAGDYETAAALYARALALDPDDPGALLGAGALLAWRGDAVGARAHAEAVLGGRPDAAAALCLRGASSMLAGDVAGALADLDRAAALDPGDPVAAVWRAEALLRLGRDGEALDEARRGGERSDDLSEHVAAQAVIALALLRGGDFPGVPEYVVRPALEALARDAEGAAWADPPPADAGAALEGALRGALAALRGNRTPVATYVRRDGSLARLAAPPSPRAASKRALWRFVATGDLGEALDALDRVRAWSPRAAEPCNYRGELFLYVGDAASARREFERALGLYGRSRWAYIGLAGAAVLDGDFEGALRHLDEGARRAGAPGPTAFAYRGEALRRLGRAGEARAELATALGRHPGRVGARVNLALLDLAEGDLAAAHGSLAELRRRAPGFAADAEGAAGGGDLAGLFEAMLTMLRGNRASSCVTYFTPDGRLRAVPPSAG